MQNKVVESLTKVIKWQRPKNDKALFTRQNFMLILFWNPCEFRAEICMDSVCNPCNAMQFIIPTWIGKSALWGKKGDFSRIDTLSMRKLHWDSFTICLKRNLNRLPLTTALARQDVDQLH